jgi:hypothetical protein
VIYLAFFFIRQLNKQLAQIQRRQMRKKDEQRTIYNNRRPGRSR